MTADNQHYIIERIRKSIGLHNFSSVIRKKNLILKKPNHQTIPTYLITLADLRHLIIWDYSEEEDIDDVLKNELIICFQNTGAISGLLVLRKTILQINYPIHPTSEFTKKIESIQPIFSGEIVHEYSWIAEALDQYLNSLHRSISRSFFQTYGEGEKGSRNRVILSGILKTILMKMVEECGFSERDTEPGLFIHHLISLGTDVPWYPSKPGNNSGFNTGECKGMIEGGLAVPVPEPLRIWLLDPILIVRAVHRLIKKQKTLEKRKKDVIISDCDTSAITTSPLFQHVIRGLFTSERCNPAIIDPFSGTGEMALLLLRMVTAACGSPGSRFEKISRELYCSDSSLSFILITRFGVILQGIEGDFSHPDLYKSARDDILQAIRDNVRVGSSIFSPDIQHEYCSEQEGKAAIHSLRPISKDWPEIPPEKNGVLISMPCRMITWKNPEIMQFLCKKYSSFSRDAITPLYAAEHAIHHRSFDSFFFLPSSWLSEYQAGSFRKWVKKSRVTSLILEEKRENIKGNGMWSCLITGVISPDMEIIRISDDGSISSFQTKRTDLPDEDGWNLEDPSENRILESVMSDSVPFSDYCLGALYQPGEISSEMYEVLWISIKASDSHLMFSTGKECDPHADVIVKGPDPYLEGILSSSVIQWYWRYITRTQSTHHPDVMIASVPIHQPDWFNQDEKESVQRIMTFVGERAFLLQKMQYARSYHDSARIRRQLLTIEKALDEEICFLYRIPKPLCERLLIRGNNSSF